MIEAAILIFSEIIAENYEVLNKLNHPEKNDIVKKLESLYCSDKKENMLTEYNGHQCSTDMFKFLVGENIKAIWISKTDSRIYFILGSGAGFSITNQTQFHYHKPQEITPIYNKHLERLEEQFQKVKNEIEGCGLSVK